MWYRALLIFAFLSYGVFVHLSVRLQHPEWAAALLFFIAFLVVYVRLHFVSRCWLSALLLFGWLLLLVFPGQGWHLVLFGMPPLVFVFLAWVFASTLRDGRVPVVTRFARAMRESTTPRIEHYTRMATIAWALFFTVMALQATIFAILAPPTLWASLSNIVNFGLTLLMFLGEYIMRRIYLRGEAQSGFSDYVRRLGQIDLRKLLES